MTTPRRTPQDRKTKATDDTTASEPGYFSFTSGGKTYTFPEPFSKVQSPGWLRANRRRDELDIAFTIIETLAGEEDEAGILKVIDKMPRDEFNKLSQRLSKALQDSAENEDVMGESAAS